MSNKSKLRALTVGAKKQFKTKVVEWDGAEVEVRQCSLSARDELLNKARNEDDTLNSVSLLVWSVILCAYDPESGERLYDESDFDALRDQPTDGFVDRFGNAALELLGLTKDDAHEKKSED